MNANSVEELQGLGYTGGVILGSLLLEGNFTGDLESRGATASIYGKRLGGVGGGTYIEATYTFMADPINIGAMTFEQLTNYINDATGYSFTVDEIMQFIYLLHSVF